VTVLVLGASLRAGNLGVKPLRGWYIQTAKWTLLSNSGEIIGLTIYTKAGYWTSGAWTRKIQIADLDLPATLKQNHDRGVAFQLPSGPDEVILRP